MAAAQPGQVGHLSVLGRAGDPVLVDLRWGLWARLVPVVGVEAEGPREVVPSGPKVWVLAVRQRVRRAPLEAGVGLVPSSGARGGACDPWGRAGRPAAPRTLAGPHAPGALPDSSAGCGVPDPLGWRAPAGTACWAVS